MKVLVRHFMVPSVLVPLILIHDDLGWSDSIDASRAVSRLDNATFRLRSVSGDSCGSGEIRKAGV